MIGKVECADRRNEELAGEQIDQSGTYDTGCCARIVGTIGRSILVRGFMDTCVRGPEQDILVSLCVNTEKTGVVLRGERVHERGVSHARDCITFERCSGRCQFVGRHSP